MPARLPSPGTITCLLSALLLASAGLPSPSHAAPSPGYHRFPAVHGDFVVFTSEGDLWRVPVTGGTAQRLTSNPGTETHPAISPDGATIAFSADVHLRAMGAENIAEWARHFYPVFQRQGLIIDVRHNRGGNIDSWILGKLLRKAWFYWQARTGDPFWNMQYAFRGHVVVLCNEFTASDGEAFSEGFKRLGLGKVISPR